MINNIKIIVLILITTNFLNIFADDGSWNKSFTIEGGSIYSEDDNTDIELIKEILIFNGEYTKAVFQFKNTSSKAVTTECGFPVQYRIETYLNQDHLEIPVSPYGYDQEIPALNYFETRPLENTGSEDDFIGAYPEIIPITDFNNIREYISLNKIPKDLKFRILQNNKEVNIEKILLERHADKKGAWLTFHFNHQLRFKPGEISVVTVEYTNDLYHGSDGMSNAFLWNYVIGTGGTWKGTIGEFYLLKPKDWQGELPMLDLIWGNSEVQLYKSNNYEPHRDDMFTLRGYSVDYMEQYEYLENELPQLKKMWNSRSILTTQPVDAVQEFVTDITASSFLPDNLSVFTNRGVILKADFSPAAAFDGLTETAWCENAERDGIGETLEFTLTEKVWGITLRNGFTRMPVQDWLFEGDYFESQVRDDSKGLKDYFTQNNRISTLSIASIEGSVLYTLELSDKRDPQTFTGINLDPGTYVLIIEEVYRGTKWRDTCLGEVAFLEAESNPIISLFASDPFFIKALEWTSFK